MTGNDAYTKSLLHLNTDLADSAVGGSHTWTARGTAAVSTTQKKFGAGSLYLDGNSDWIDAPDSDDWNLGSGDWTIDLWVYFGVVNTYQTLYTQRVDIDNRVNLWYYGGGDGSIRFYARNTVGVICYFYTGAWTPSVNTWYHIAVVRSGDTPLIFIDGVSKAITESTAIAGKTLPDLAALARVGFDGASYYFSGYLDEFRLSKGIARWTAGFTPPTEEYNILWTKDLSDTITLSEAIFKKPYCVKTDTIILSDPVAKGVKPTLSDTIALSDLVAKTPGLSLADSISLGDSLTKKFGLSKDDVITLVDFFDYLLISGALTLNLSDTISLSDQIAKSVATNPIDSISLSDAISKIIGLSESDSINLADLMAKSFSLKLTDQVTLLDQIKIVKRTIDRFLYSKFKLTTSAIPEGGFTYKKEKQRFS